MIKATKDVPPNVQKDNYDELINASYNFIKSLNKCINNKENLERPGLHDTPERFARAHLELIKGYNSKFDFTMFPLDENSGNNNDNDNDNENNNENKSNTNSNLTPVLVKDIPFSSCCEHHILPFYGVAHVAYIPGDKVLGLSKFARNLKVLAKRWQIQEKLTKEFCELLMDTLNAKGVAVMIEAVHTCMTIRGAESPAVTTTCAYIGLMDTIEKRNEFFSMIGNNKKSF